MQLGAAEPAQTRLLAVAFVSSGDGNRLSGLRLQESRGQVEGEGQGNADLRRGAGLAAAVWITGLMILLAWFGGPRNNFWAE